MRRHSALRSLAAATLLLVALTACGGSSDSTSAVGSTSSATAKAGTIKSIFFANPLPSYPDWGTADRCFKAETERLGIKGVTQGPTGLQIQDQFVLDRISQAIAQDYDAIMMVPITPSAYDPLIKRAKDKDMYVATLNTGDSTKNQNFVVGTDYQTQGKLVAGELGKREGQQNVDVIINAFKDNLPPNVKVVDTAFDGGDPSKTADVVSAMLTANPETNIVFSWEGTAVGGITTAIKEKKKVGTVFGVVNDLTDQVVAGIKGGTLYGTSRQHFCDMAKQSVQNFVALSEGKTVAPVNDSGVTFVTKDNLEQVLADAKKES
jgi:ABC-type sugar transport system substrate-binding protein